jgi:predicted permease
MLLVLMGTLVALSIARWGGGLVRSTLLPDVYFPGGSMSTQVLLYAGFVSALAAVAAGVVPGLTKSRFDHGFGFAGTARAHTATHTRLRRALTVTQATACTVLLVGAGLFVLSLDRLRALDLGFDVDRMVIVNFDYVGNETDLVMRREVFASAIRRVSTLPGVADLATTATPFGTGYGVQVRIPGRDSLPRVPTGGPYILSVSPGYFETTGLSVLRGRPILDTDVAGAPGVAVVNETMAATYWPDEDPLGQCLLIGRGQPACTTVVGVVERSARFGYRDSPSLEYYVPMEQLAGAQPLTSGAQPLTSGTQPLASAGAGAAPPSLVPEALTAPAALYVRAERDPRDLSASLAEALASVSPDVRWPGVQTMEERLAPGARAWRLGATMFTIFGLLALIVAAIGLYSVLAFDVAQRTRELGIRTALGARKSRLMRSVLQRGTALAGVGVALGLGLAYLAAPYAQSMLFETSARDPWVFGAVGGVLLTVGLFASLVPGLRATRVDPMIALRAD